MTPEQMQAQQDAELIAALHSGPAPWPSIFWALGGMPEKGVDIPISAVFLALYVIGGICHMTLFQLNRRGGHFFPWSGAMFGLCFLRTITMSLRIAWTSDVHNVKLAMAANIFVAAGVLVVYVVNLFFTQRIWRARHPHVGWSKAALGGFLGLLALIPLCLAMVITTVVQSFYTLSVNTHRIDRDVQLGVSSYLFFVAFLPVPLLAAALIYPMRTTLDRFGTGHHRSQIAIVLAGALTISLGAGYRLGTSAMDPVLITEPLPGYFHKACFYIFNFVVELVVMYFYLFIRIDQRFHIPNGASGPGSYSAGKPRAVGATDAEHVSGEEEPKSRSEESL